jgi:hypothetical protein
MMALDIDQRLVELTLAKKVSLLRGLSACNKLGSAAKHPCSCPLRSCPLRGKLVEDLTPLSLTEHRWPV